MTNNTFLQLMDDEKTTMLSVEQREFVETHKQIVSYGSLAGRYFVELARKLKTMRDGKLYKAAGFEDFGAYVEEAVGLKTRQAYNYIKVAEKYTDKYLEDHADIGITKLTLLAQVTESEREEIEENINISEASTKDVDEAVKEALRERDEAQKQLDLFAEENESLKAEIAERESGQDGLQKAFEEKKAELDEAKKQAADLKAKEAELKRQLKEAKASKTETVTVQDEESKKVAAAEKARADELEQKLRETTAQLAVAKEQKKTIASNDLLLFKVKFDDLQRLGEDMSGLLAKMDAETAGKCKNALAAVMTAWKEDMGL